MTLKEQTAMHKQHTHKFRCQKIENMSHYLTLSFPFSYFIENKITRRDFSVNISDFEFANFSTV